LTSIDTGGNGCRPDTDRDKAPAEELEPLLENNAELVVEVTSFLVASAEDVQELVVLICHPHRDD
jgi:hypothetical protein